MLKATDLDPCATFFILEGEGVLFTRIMSLKLCIMEQALTLPWESFPSVSVLIKQEHPAGTAGAHTLLLSFLLIL